MKDYLVYLAEYTWEVVKHPIQYFYHLRTKWQHRKGIGVMSRWHISRKTRLEILKNGWRS
jgi:hypothetical protein